MMLNEMVDHFHVIFMIGFSLPSSSKREGNSSSSSSSNQPSDDQSNKNDEEEEEEDENEKKEDEFPFKHLLNDSVSSYWKKKY